MALYGAPETSVRSGRHFDVTEDIHNAIGKLHRGDGRNVIQMRPEQNLFDYCRSFLKNGQCESTPNASRTTLYQSLDGGNIVYHDGFLYGNGSNESNAQLFCQEKEKCSCPSFASLATDGRSLSLGTGHEGHGRDEAQCMSSLCDRVFRERVAVGIDAVASVVEEKLLGR